MNVIFELLQNTDPEVVEQRAAPRQQLTVGRQQVRDLPNCCTACWGLACLIVGVLDRPCAQHPVHADSERLSE